MRMNNLLWVIGRLILDEGVQIGWEAQGIFNTKQAAQDAAQNNEFIACVKMDERFPDNAVDAIEFFYPKHEAWETSELFKKRHGGLN